MHHTEKAGDGRRAVATKRCPPGVTSIVSQKS